MFVNPRPYPPLIKNPFDSLNPAKIFKPAPKVLTPKSPKLPLLLKLPLLALA
jgi:hypothetical protein